jgi:hypothetical protein
MLVELCHYSRTTPIPDCKDRYVSQTSGDVRPDVVTGNVGLRRLAKLSYRKRRIAFYEKELRAV